jgi:hypothetical protein
MSHPAALGLALAAAIALSPAARSGEGEGPPEGPTLSDADRTAIRSVLTRLAAAMMHADPAAIGELLSPTLRPAEKNRIIGRARGELEKVSYPRFGFDTSGEMPAEFVGPDEVKIVVPATYEYEGRMAGGEAGRGDMAYEFRFIRSEDGWLIAGSELFEQFTPLRFGQVLGWLFLGGFLGVLVLFFWIWMAFDAWMRTKRLRYAFLLMLSTPVGAGLYFFAVYLRRQFVPRDE